jgi:hypothetical protein
MDVGGTKGETTAAFAVHGGRPNDGYRFREGLYDGALSCVFGSNPFSSVNPATIQEVTIQLTGGLSVEAPTGGTQSNVVLRDGGNRVSGTLQVDFGHKNLQSRNIDQELTNRGVRTPPTIKELHDFAAGIGGPLVRDKVWFFGDARDWTATSYLANIYYDRTPGDLFYEPDLSRPGYNGTGNRSGGLRITWQASPKDKIASYATYEHTYNPYFGLEGGTASPEGVASHAYRPQKLAQVNWTRPATDRLLFQLGALKVGGVAHFQASPGDQEAFISVVDRLPNRRYGSVGKTERKYSQSNVTGSVSYLTGGHAFRVGGTYMNGYREEAPYINQNISYTFAGVVPESVTYYAYPLIYDLKLRIFAAYAQDQWTFDNLTLNLGIRYDYMNGLSPAATSPAGRWVPERSFAEVNNTPNWHDIHPRVGFAYNLFGSNTTVVKGNLGRFLPLETTNGVVNSANPSASTVTQANRSWRDANGDYIPQESELGPLSNAAFGQSVINTVHSKAVLEGFGVRPYNWQGSLSVQHEVFSGFAVNVGYFRTWYGNFFATDNLLVTPADFQSYCITGPADSQLPGGGGERVCGLLDIVPSKFGQVQNEVRHASDFGKQTEVYNGVDVTMQARFGNGGLLSGGLSTSQTVTDNCEVMAALPELAGANSAPSRFCRVSPPWSAATQLKFSGTYTLPYDVRLGGTYQNIPGLATTASFVTVGNTPEIVSQLGRALSGGRQAQVELIEPQTDYREGRISMLSFNVSKIFRFGSTRIEPTVSIFNALNANPVQIQTTRYGPAWRNVTGVLAARTVKFGARIDF